MREEQGGVGGLRMAELLAALSIAQDLGVGFPSGYVLHGCYIAAWVAEGLGIPLHEKRDVFYAAATLKRICGMLAA